MYLVQEGPEAASLTCTDGMMFNLVDQFVNDVDITKQDLGPTSPYLQAESVCCGGCAPIMPANQVCTGPAMPGTG
ncbi:hypothetical protein AAVH_16631 [Aphelenchoides avenae]|nr:hypothetical protein AAVH_16631 [Aphelenchus avenae]